MSTPGKLPENMRRKQISEANGKAMRLSSGITGNMHGSQRPKNYVESSIARGVTKWSSAYLPGYLLVELEAALVLVKKHPDQASRGYSAAKNARQRLEMEINRQRALPQQAA